MRAYIDMIRLNRIQYAVREKAFALNFLIKLEPF